MSPPPQSNTELPAHQGVPSKEASAFQTEIAFFPFWFKKEELAGSEDGGEWRSRRREQWERHGAGVSTERVIAGFNRLGQDQRGLASKAAELAMELDEHSAVTDTLKEVADETRKCCLMLGGVLGERTVQEALRSQMLTQQLQAKGKELNELWEKHNLRLLGEGKKPAAKENSEGAGAKATSAGVLVS
uniref:Uncharacterized protein n=1 Tax=Bos mutus grunniens TaxID=30521 RepID=A0A8B9WSQ2_BOSMU